MFCPHCGSPVAEGEICACQNTQQQQQYYETPGFDPNTQPPFGGPVPPNTGFQPPQPPIKTNAMAIAGFVVSLVSLFLNLWGLVGAVGIVLSAVGMTQIKKTGEKGNGLAITGLVIGILSVIYAIFIISAGYSVLRMFSSYY